MKRVFNSLLILTFLLSGTAHAQKEEPAIYDNICIDEQEQILLKSINEYRKDNALNTIPLSASLCYVAQTHVRDLFLYKPHRGNCSLHSWSGKGRWSQCCYNNSRENGNCMFEKPSELTDYESQGYEVVYYQNNPVEVKTVMEVWQSDYQSKSILLNLAGWENYNWNAIGISIFENYVSVWFGETREKNKPVKLCNTNQIINQTPDTVQAKDQPLFYLIVYSYKRRDDATKRLEQLRKQGYSNARMLVKDNNYRIAIDSYATMEEAEAMRKKLKNKYPDAWVLKK
ncbi:MAG: SPOR domain-containing protein [Bacteroidales bacterium]|nr:SPOR domain-containing protein [Bacteroidales bacterium]